MASGRQLIIQIGAKREGPITSKQAYMYKYYIGMYQR